MTTKTSSDLIKWTLTLVGVFSNYPSFHGASIGLLGCLLLEGVARRAGECGAGFHRPLESVSLPSKEVVTVLSIAGARKNYAAKRQPFSGV